MFRKFQELYIANRTNNLSAGGRLAAYLRPSGTVLHCLRIPDNCIGCAYILRYDWGASFQCIKLSQKVCEHFD
jgi:hypothetical protein